ncbi:bifunctional 4-hydroxy-2-oxoglutarate aldolase/2-dehydro-3-deoxy-phosphogluconate aldolase [Kineobactrum salinum]|uniref:2-dehydro-3-deoxy-phosphogluconate aldolase n=1 Tax=Kineobactrum salinum TaxID=2708301 RepID=A0A6C0TWU0_9GAMM|nr:bifunctional 4-hydroxy-2-oxoglutarate aldolase/2-dehydro-3-deoxy-phosphogluconate aldolase [Kineobactrum salinum]QIB64246.1 bifunctional 4-hydroxy-2-oxoglutarate aldolase/2-dehydro-3-deoxy-phosphogluconate aldolase [Kineobactrum salinum]
MIRNWLRTSRVLPVITPGEVDTTLHLVRTLAAAGMPALEITLRAESALDCIRAIRSELPELRLAAGTVLTPEQLEQALAAGAELLLSPGATPALLRAAREAGAPLVPGVATASEVMAGLEQGFDCFKLFPAATAGGMALLKSLAGPFPAVGFCPTGGLDADNFRAFLALPNVLCCGGSWMVDRALIEAERWDEIAYLASQAMRES